MSYIEERFKNIQRAKKDPEVAKAIAKIADMPSPVPEPEYNLRPKFLSHFVSQYCQWVGRNWREANIRREQEERDAQIQTSGAPA